MEIELTRRDGPTRTSPPTRTPLRLTEANKEVPQLALLLARELVVLVLKLTLRPTPDPKLDLEELLQTKASVVNPRNSSSNSLLALLHRCPTPRDN